MFTLHALVRKLLQISKEGLAPEQCLHRADSRVGAASDDRALRETSVRGEDRRVVDRGSARRQSRSPESRVSSSKDMTQAMYVRSLGDEVRLALVATSARTRAPVPIAAAVRVVPVIVSDSKFFLVPVNHVSSSKQSACVRSHRDEVGLALVAKSACKQIRRPACERASADRPVLRSCL